MKDGREKVGDATDHKLASHVVIPKAKRLVLPFGGPERRRRDQRDTEHEHYIREIPIAGGGLGCALWDGGLVLARWVYNKGPSVFLNQSVLELGCGVGLAGIVAAHWASTVTLTDYIDDTVRNAVYNVKLNSCDNDSSSSDGDDEDAAEVEGGTVGGVAGAPSARDVPYQRCIAHRVHARLLDWDAELQLQPPEEHDPASPSLVAPVRGEGAAYCTGVSDHLGHRAPMSTQPWVRCETCWPADASRGVCVPCSLACHRDHVLVPQPAERFCCDCRLSESGVCLACPPQPPLSRFDIIIGSELTYNLLSCGSLAFVVDKYLKKPHGVFYEVLSDDRDGVAVFIEEMERRGFETVKRPAPRQYVGAFGTRKWSKQDQESYSFYTWRRLECPPKLLMPVME